MNLDSEFDIFKRLPNGDPLWIGTVRGLKEANQRMALEAGNSPGEYFIFLHRNGVVAKFGTVVEEKAHTECLAFLVPTPYSFRTESPKVILGRLGFSRAEFLGHLKSISTTSVSDALVILSGFG